MDIQQYNNCILDIKKNIGDLRRRVLEIKQRVIDSSHEDASEINCHVDATMKELQKKSLEKIENDLRGAEHGIEEIGELSIGDDVVDIIDDKEAHPFTRNTLVLSVIFGFLNGDSLKQCRLVNHNWKENCAPFFKTLMQISITDPESFLLDISSSKLDCGRYEFTCSDLVISDFQDILLQDVSMLTSLTLTHVTFYDNFGRLRVCNLNELLGGKELYLKKLIVCDSKGLVIPIERLAEIEYLDLVDCKIVFPEGYDGKISSPKYLRLENILFIRPTGEKVEEIRVDRLFKLGKVKEINIDQSSSHTLLHLCLEEETTKEMINCVGASGEVNLLTSRNLKLKALTISVFNLAYEYDLSTNLPETLECLSICMASQENHQIVPENYALPPNLKYLYASYLKLSPTLLHKLSASTQLKFVHLQSVSRVQFDISWLPPSVETIILSEMRTTFLNERQLNVKDLIILDCDNDSILDILTRIKAENLYLRFKEPNRTEQNSQILLQIYQQRYYWEMCKVQSFIWQDQNEFQNSPLFHIVDKRAGSYTFEGGFGKAEDTNITDSNDAFDNTMSFITSYIHQAINSVASEPSLKFPHFFQPHWKYTQ